MNTARIAFSGFEEMRAKLNKLGADTEQIAIEALKATNELVYKAAKEAIQKPNLPAKGKYSRKSGGTEDSLLREPIIEKKGTEIVAYVGFDTKNGGFPSIFLLRGTPYHEPVKPLVDAFYGQNAEIMAVQKDIFERALERIMSE